MLRPINGVTYNLEVEGEGDPLLLLHGFTGSIATWRPHLPLLQQNFRTIALDLIGHGESHSPADPDRYQMESCVKDLIAILEGLSVERAHVLGYSMGGRVALSLAVTEPGRVRSLIIESSSPGLAETTERQARIVADETLADMIESEGIEAFVNLWERLPLFASQAALPSEIQNALRQQRLQNNPAGLANSLRGMGVGRQESLWRLLPSIDVPTFLIAGELDSKYCKISQEMLGAMPRARLAIIQKAGHAVHLEQPRAFDRTVLQFLLEH